MSLCLVTLYYILLASSNSKSFEWHAWCGNLKLRRNICSPGPGKSCHEIMEIPQSKTRGEMQAYVTINEARPKAKEEPCSFYVCNHAVHRKEKLPQRWEKEKSQERTPVQFMPCKTTQVLGVLYFCTCSLCVMIYRWTRFLFETDKCITDTHILKECPKGLQTLLLLVVVEEPFTDLYACSGIAYVQIAVVLPLLGTQFRSMGLGLNLLLIK